MQQPKIQKLILQTLDIEKIFRQLGHAYLQKNRCNVKVAFPLKTKKMHTKKALTYKMYSNVERGKVKFLFSNYLT